VVHFGPLVLTTPVTLARLNLNKLQNLYNRWKNYIIVVNILLVNIILGEIIVYLCLWIIILNFLMVLKITFLEWLYRPCDR
jgi:hypothetical protein